MQVDATGGPKNGALRVVPTIAKGIDECDDPRNLRPVGNSTAGFAVIVEHVDIRDALDPRKRIVAVSAGIEEHREAEGGRPGHSGADTERS